MSPRPCRSVPLIPRSKDRPRFRFSHFLRRGVVGLAQRSWHRHSGYGQHHRLDRSEGDGRDRETRRPRRSAPSASFARSSCTSALVEAVIEEHSTADEVARPADITDPARYSASRAEAFLAGGARPCGREGRPPRPPCPVPRLQRPRQGPDPSALVNAGIGGWPAKSESRAGR